MTTTMIATPAMVEDLARHGLTPVNLIFEDFDPENIPGLLQVWQRYGERAIELKMSTQQVAGIADAAADIIRCRNHPDAVRALAILIGQADQPVAEVVRHAEILSHYLMAGRPAPTA